MENLTSLAEYQAAYSKSLSDPENFWSEVAEGFTWRKKWTRVLEWDFRKPEVKWFIGGPIPKHESTFCAR
jgi:acetyl-CoA synthetase